MDEERIKIVVHHSGQFLTDDNDVFKFDGEIAEWSVDADLLSYFGIVASVKELEDNEGEEDGGSSKSKTTFPTFSMPRSLDGYKWEVGTFFAEKNEFMDAIRTYALSNGRNLKFIKNDKKRICVKCLGGKGKCNCCSRDFNVKLMTSKWLSERMEKSVKENPTMKVMDIRDKMTRKWNVGISRNMAFKARAVAKDKIEGSLHEQYRRLYDYGHELLKTNSGSTVQIKVDNINGEVIFQRFYACLKACKDSFASCRPIVGLDECFLKTKYGGELLTTVGRDGNEQMLPIAYVVVEVENKESWTWFLELLIEDLGGKDVCARITFISDQQKVWNRFQNESSLGRYWLPRWSREKLFEVIHISEFGHQFVVNVDTMNCTCRKWAITGVPCTHAITSMKFLNINAKDYISHWFRKPTYEETYNTKIYPINGQHIWEVTPYSDILPPKKKTMPGRPKKKRRLEEWELKKNDSELRKGGQRKKCGICNELGHNKKGCPQRPTAQSASEQTQGTQGPPTDVPLTQESTVIGTESGPPQQPDPTVNDE
ncbi:uncharacterized protein LOC106758121 [Vigna radiata var. radiata]|uniref:Uncharacterized protein LOC106758121 n=1 Tax=Vigna radiata var. radiata TaxID=3916 RepID=A0A1S3TRY6_VIGRR|nr:uncharacterized protein LOC106758121 [Vigna radiata var. radiata]